MKDPQKVVSKSMFWNETFSEKIHILKNTPLNTTIKICSRPFIYFVTTLIYNKCVIVSITLTIHIEIWEYERLYTILIDIIY